MNCYDCERIKTAYEDTYAREIPSVKQATKFARIMSKKIPVCDEHAQERASEYHQKIESM